MKVFRSNPHRQYSVQYCCQVAPLFPDQVSEVDAGPDPSCLFCKTAGVMMNRVWAEGQGIMHHNGASSFRSIILVNRPLPALPLVRIDRAKALNNNLWAPLSCFQNLLFTSPRRRKNKLLNHCLVTVGDVGPPLTVPRVHFASSSDRMMAKQYKIR